MNPYRESNIPNTFLSLKEELYLSGSPGKRILFYFFTCLEGLVKLTGFILLFGLIISTVSAIVCGIFSGLSYLFRNYHNWFVGSCYALLILLFLIVLTSILTNDFKEDLKMKLNESKMPQNNEESKNG